MRKPKYFDWNATTPIHKDVLNIINYYLEVEYGNAGSRTHIYGAEAKKAVSKARKQISDVVEASKEDVIFTSGATESNNIAILGLEEYGNKTKKKHIITSPIEHKAVLEPINVLEKRGFEIEYLPMDKSGRVKTKDVENKIRPDTLLVSIMQVNNETGIRQPITEIATVLEKYDSYFHVDAAQGFGKELEPLCHQRIDLISASGHKIQGPKGIGALIMRKRNYKRAPLQPIFFGGGQERELRPGTLAVPLIAGFGMAAEILSTNNNQWWNDRAKIKESVLQEIESEFFIIGDQTFSMPNCCYLILENWDSEAFILSNKNKWAVSNGSACTSDKITPSHVLEAMGLDSEHGGVRFSF